MAVCIGLAIERAGAQQGAGANVNVISGTGADGDWTLQRQNEPTMACSSRNPQNCLAGANDYRTVDIPFPNIGEKVTGDAWLGWYTTKNAGLTWRTRLLPGYPQDVSPAGIASPLKGYPAGADPIIRPGTNGMFYYGGLVFARDEGGGSAIFVARFIDNNNQEGTAGEPIAYLGASIVHRLGAAPTVVAARRPGRGEARAPRVAGRTDRNAATRGQQVRAGVEQAGETEQMVDKPWMAVDIPRAGATTCSIGGTGTGVPLQTFPGGNVYMAYAMFDGPGEQRGRIMFSRSTNCGATWSAPRVLSRVPSADVNDDGVANTADVTRLQASLGRSCGHVSFNSNADTNNDCIVNSLDLNFVARGVGLPVPKQPRLSQGATLAIDPQTGTLQVAWRQFNDGVMADAIVAVRSTNGGAAFRPPRVVAHARLVRSGHERHVVPHERLPDDGIRRRRTRVPGLVVAWVCRAAARSCLWRCADRHVDVDQWHHVVHAHGRRQRRGAGTSDHAGARLRAGQAAAHLLRPPRGRLAALRPIRRRAADPERRAPAAHTSYRRRLGSAGGSRSESLVHAVPHLAVPLRRCARVPDGQPLEFNPPNLPIFRAGTLAVHGRLPRRRDRSAVCPQRIGLELQHRGDGESRVPRHLDGQPRHPAAG